MARERLRMREAARRALDDEMAANADVVVLGEDVAVAGGPFKVTDGLLDKYGERRVIDTPISEAGFLGAAVGAAGTGLRPVVEIMFVEFIGVAFDQLVTEAAKVRYLSRGRVGCPMVVRATVGAGLGFGCQHSQILDGWFRGTPGLKLCIPADSASMYGLLRAAIRDDDPVVFLEHKAMYGNRGEVEVGDAGIMELGRGAVVEGGNDVTVVASGATVGIAREAAAAARDAGPSAGPSMDVIDLRTLVPWDREVVMESISRTGRLVTVEEGPHSGGWGAEVVAHVAAQLHRQLHAPPLRITSPDVPIPFAAALEERYLPTPELVGSQVAQLVTTNEVVLPWWQAEALV